MLGGLQYEIQYFGHLMQRVDSLEKTLMLGGIGGRRRRGWQRMRRLVGIPDSIDMSLSRLRELVLDREAWCATVHGVTKSQTWLSYWTELKYVSFKFSEKNIGILISPLSQMILYSLTDRHCLDLRLTINEKEIPKLQYKFICSSVSLYSDGYNLLV